MKAPVGAIAEMPCSVVADMSAEIFKIHLDRINFGEQRCSTKLWNNPRKYSHSPAKRRIELKIGRTVSLDRAFRLSHRGIESTLRFKRKENISSRCKKNTVHNLTKTLFHSTKTIFTAASKTLFGRTALGDSICIGFSAK